MDDITRGIHDQYARFPYPSRDPGEGRLKELANLLRLFAMENKYDLAGKTVLDVGTGTGHRLVTAARVFPNTQFLAVDLAEEPLAIARATADKAGVSNVRFHRHNLLEDTDVLGRFDLVLCMGVLHHLPDPLAGVRRLAEHLADDGLLFAYVYGSIGGAERMRRKEILSVLLQGRNDMDLGLRLARELGFADGAFGWNLNAGDDASRDALIVDSYFNVNESLFDASGLMRMMSSSGLERFMMYGITSGKSGHLFDTGLAPDSRLMVTWTDMRKHLRAPAAVSAYERLTLEDKYRIVDLAYQPNGYTLLAYGPGAVHHFPAAGRVLRNSLKSVK